jgi:hypothetical protein
MRDWAALNNVELAYTPHYASWLNRIEAQFRALQYFTLAGTDHPDHATQARLIRRYTHWPNHNTNNPRLKRLINTANVASHPTRTPSREVLGTGGWRVRHSGCPARWFDGMGGEC